MTTDRFAERLSDYLDGEMDPEGCVDMERHLETCAYCRDELQGLRRVVACLDAAPQGGPAHDLWPALQGQIERESDGGGQRMLRTPVWRIWLPAAAALAVAGSLALWWMSGGLPFLSPDVPSVPTVEAGALDPYRRVVDEWRQAVNVNALPEPLAASVRSDLEDYDRAVAEGLAALEEMPGDAALTAHVIRTLQAQARLLSRVSQATEIL